MSELSKILTEANTQKWSLRDIENQAAQHGHKLNFSTVGKYLNGTHGRPTAEVLNAFADVFRLDANRLREAAGLPDLGTPFILPAEAAQLTGPEREAIKHLVRVMVESKAVVGAGVPLEQVQSTKRAMSKRELERAKRPPVRVVPKSEIHRSVRDSPVLPKNFFELAANDVPSRDIQEHRERGSLGEESQEYPEG